MYLPVDPVMIQIGNFSLYWYGIIITLAIFLGALAAHLYVTRHGGEGHIIWDILLWVSIPAIIGARLYYVFIQSPRGPDGFDRYMANPIEITQIWMGGIHIYGSLLFGALALFLYFLLHKLPYLLFLDGIGLGLALGQASGRLANFLNQEFYGPPTSLPWGLSIDTAHRVAPYTDLVKYPESIHFQPLFLYEMGWDGIGFLVLLWISRRFASRLRRGDLFLLYLIWIPLGRFWIEFLRTDSWFLPGTPFTVLHCLIAPLVIGAIVVLFRRHRPQPARQIITGPNEAPVTQSRTSTAAKPEATSELVVDNDEGCSPKYTDPNTSGVENA